MQGSVSPSSLARASASSMVAPIPATRSCAAEIATQVPGGISRRSSPSNVATFKISPLDTLNGSMNTILADQKKFTRCLERQAIKMNWDPSRRAPGMCRLCVPLRVMGGGSRDAHSNDRISVSQEIVSASLFPVCPNACRGLISIVTENENSRHSLAVN